MKTRIGPYSFFAFTLVAGLVVSLSVTPVNSAELQAAASRAPWTTQVFEVDTYAVNLSTTFGGPEQMPEIVNWYSRPSNPGIGFYNKWLNLCGPGDEWYCEYVVGTNLNPDTLSAVAEYTFINSYKLAVAYEKPDNWVYLLTREFASDGEPVYINEERVFYTGTSYNIYGRPSVAFDEYGDAHVTFVIKYNSNHILMYAHETATTNTSCGTDLKWQCDVVKNVASEMLGGQPTIVINAANSPRIIYYYGSNQNLVLAYPKAALVPGTCGPDNSWRCVSIFEDIQSNSAMDMAIGDDQSQPHFAWTFTDGLNQTWVYHAHYVGAGGNCGNDASYNPISHQVIYDNRWDCRQVGLIGLNASYKHVSIAVDPENNPVMAYNADNGNTFDLYVAYGIPGDPYTYQGQKVDGGSISTGLQADISIDKYGRGFIAYIEDREYEPTLKIAFQESYVYLPLIKR